MNKNSVLIIDDEVGPRESLRMVFKNKYRVFVAEDGFKGLDILRNESIDLVISDVKMPKLSGVGVLKKVKDYDPTIEVILLSGALSTEIERAIKRHKVHAYMSKPFNVPELERVVREGIKKRESRDK